MTETQWLTAATPAAMLKFIGPKASARKLQLLGVACCRPVLARLAGQQFDEFDTARCQHLLDLTERQAEGNASREEWRIGLDIAQRLLPEYLVGVGTEAVAPVPALHFALLALVSTPILTGIGRVLQWTNAAATRSTEVGYARPVTQGMLRQQADLLREIFGNPFVERTVVPAWMSTGGSTIFPGWMIQVSETAKALADGIEADQAYERLPILADAMEEAGCTDTDFLAHLREPGHHVRGCWALDLVLGKS